RRDHVDHEQRPNGAHPRQRNSRNRPQYDGCETHGSAQWRKTSGDRTRSESGGRRGSADLRTNRRKIVIATRQSCHAGFSTANVLARFAWMLRGCSSSESELAFPYQHQIANVNKRVWKVSQYADGVRPENKIQAHQHASGNAPVPERAWDDTFALSLRGEPLHEETHREKSV